MNYTALTCKFSSIQPFNLQCTYKGVVVFIKPFCEVLSITYPTHYKPGRDYALRGVVTGNSHRREVVVNCSDLVTEVKCPPLCLHFVEHDSQLVVLSRGYPEREVRRTETLPRKWTPPTC